MLKLLVLCVFFTAIVADPDPNLISLVTAPFRYIGRWLTGSHSNNYYKNDRYYHYNKYDDYNDWHYNKKRSVPDSEPIDTRLLINDYITPSIAGPLDYSGAREKQSSMYSLHEENVPESVLPSSHASIFVQEENFVYDSYSPLNYFEKYFKYDVKHEAEEKEYAD